MEVKQVGCYATAICHNNLNHRSMIHACCMTAWCLCILHNHDNGRFLMATVMSSQVSSIDMTLALGVRGCEFESCQLQCSCENWEIPLVEELTANCLVETRKKQVLTFISVCEYQSGCCENHSENRFCDSRQKWGPAKLGEELIPAVMVEYGLNRVQLPLWLQQSLIYGFSWYGLSWASVPRPRRITESGGIVPLKITCVFFFFFKILYNFCCVSIPCLSSRPNVYGRIQRFGCV